MQGNVIEARYCESPVTFILVIKLADKISFKHVSVIDLDDAKDVAAANGFTDDIKIVSAKELRVRPEI